MNKAESAMVKGIAILCMLFHHLFYKAERYDKYGFTGLLFGEKGTIFIGKNLKVCVALFVLITGFGMMMVEKKARDSASVSEGLAGNLGRMYKKAAGRYFDFFRTLTYMMIFGVGVTYLLGVKKTLGSVYGTMPQIIKAVIANITGLAYYFKIDWFNSSWWYAYVAVTYMFAFPILYYLMKRMKPLGLLCASWLICFALYIKGINIPNVLEYLPIMIFGMLLAEDDLVGRLVNWGGDSVFKRLFLIFAAIAVYAVSSWLRAIVQWNFFYFVFMTGAVVILVMFLLRSIPVLNKMLVVLGDNSSYMWLIHTFVYSHWFPKQIFSLRFVPLIYLVVVVSVFVLAWILKWLTDHMEAGIRRVAHR